MYIDEGRGPTGAVGTGMADFLQAAQSGSFAVNEQGGQALLTAIRNMIDWIDENQAGWRLLAQQPRLGSTNNAEVLKPFMVQVASDSQGFVTQMMAMRESLGKAQDAIRIAMANYKHTDSDAADSLKTH
ncbi:hypothetical protein [Actinokineospora enzanensis]|uniref:hypothetical protein n=1 Tax=Actinokineospora enzanensis TaxID=155975 RepID=UPI00037F0702|nr:hypothetical protein [Actinokineospora enzanensis]